MAEPVDVDVIERSKENVQPMRGGRDPRALIDALKVQEQPNNKQLQDSLAQQRAKYEAAILSYTGPNPLTPWLDYIAWTVHSHSSVSSAQAHLLPLLEKCTRVFVSDTRLYNDSHYVSVWLLYADHCANPQSIYEFMIAKHIGDQCSVRYLKNSQWLESRGNFIEAETVLTLALERQTKPANTITAALRTLTARNARRIEKRLESMTAQELDPLSGEVQSALYDDAPRRALAVFGDKENGSASGSDPSRQPIVQTRQTHRQPAPVVSQGNARFQIFSDNRASGNNASQCESQSGWQQLGTQQASNKENIRTVTTWRTPLAMSGDSVRVKPVSDVAVFVDTECDDYLKRENSEADRATVSQQREAERSARRTAIRARLDAPSKPSTVAKLTEDPLRHINKTQPQSQPKQTTLHSSSVTTTAKAAPAAVSARVTAVQAPSALRSSAAQLTHLALPSMSTNAVRSTGAATATLPRPALPATRGLGRPPAQPQSTLQSQPLQPRSAADVIFNDFA